MNTEQKIDAIHKMVNEQNVNMAKFIAYQEQHRKEIDVNTKKIETLTTLKDKFLGIIIAISGGISIIIGVVGFFIKK